MNGSAATFAAIDLGASSGRVITGTFGRGTIALDEVHRFPNDPVQLPTGLHWDVLRLFREIVTGLRAAGRASNDAALRGIGIDSWAIDYGLLDTRGALIGNPFHYRDVRTNATGAPVDHATQYPINGLQHLPFATIHQLGVEDPARLALAEHLLLIPDLLTYWITGELGCEITNASTTGLLDASSRTWSNELIGCVGIQTALLGHLRSPGDTVGPLLPRCRELTGIGESTPFIAVGSHDTASAVVGVPAEGDTSAYICCGTWGLVGVELNAPVLTEASRLANFTNELGVDGRVRYLRNVMGLWLLQESQRTWAHQGAPTDLRTLLDAAAELPSGGPVIDVDQPEFLGLGDMPKRIRAACKRAGLPQPASRPAIVRCILDSLAAAFARTVREAAELSGRHVEVVHLVGGGAQNDLLCQLTADACELPVLAGPVEATALGNLLVQARAAGVISGDLDTLRALLRATQELRTYRPRARP